MASIELTYIVTVDDTLATPESADLISERGLKHLREFLSDVEAREPILFLR